MKFRIILSYFLALLFFASCNTASSNLKIKKDSYLVDVRTSEEFKEGSAEGSINIPVEELEERLSELKDKKNIVVFCRSGNRASTAKQILENAGFTDVINGGSWQQVKEAIK